MGIEFVDPELLPQQPELVRFKNIFIQCYPDGRRVKVKIEVTPFLQPPDIEIVVYSPDGDQVASASIVEMGSTNLEVTLHLRGKKTSGLHSCKVKLIYTDKKLVDSREIAFSVLESDNHEQG